MEETEAAGDHVAEGLCARAWGFPRFPRDVFLRHTFNSTRVQKKYTQPFTSNISPILTTNRFFEARTITRKRARVGLAVDPGGAETQIQRPRLLSRTGGCGPLTKGQWRKTRERYGVRGHGRLRTVTRHRWLPRAPSRRVCGEPGTPRSSPSGQDFCRDRDEYRLRGERTRLRVLGWLAARGGSRISSRREAGLA